MNVNKLRWLKDQNYPSDYFILCVNNIIFNIFLVLFRFKHWLKVTLTLVTWMHSFKFKLCQSILTAYNFNSYILYSAKKSFEIVFIFIIVNYIVIIVYYSYFYYIYYKCHISNMLKKIKIFTHFLWNLFLHTECNINVILVRCRSWL